MKVVVTGATSMIGAALIKECITNHCEVLAIVRKNSTRLNRLPKSEFITIVEAELNNLNGVEPECGEYDVFYHFAWEGTDKISRDNVKVQEKNIQATLDAVELARKLGCKKFIGAGSQAEYGIVKEVITENTSEQPVTAYGAAKMSANLMSNILCNRYGIKHIWARVFSVYGINDTENSVVSYAINSMLNCDVPHFSAATNMWNFLNEEDAGKAFFLLGIRDVEAGIYCVADESSRPLREYLNIIMSINGNSMEGVFDRTPLPPNTVELNVNINKLVRNTGFKSKITFEEGIRKIFLTKKEKR